MCGKAVFVYRMDLLIGGSQHLSWINLNPSELFIISGFIVFELEQEFKNTFGVI